MYKKQSYNAFQAVKSPNDIFDKENNYSKRLIVFLLFSTQNCSAAFFLRNRNEKEDNLLIDGPYDERYLICNAIEWC